jgi:hypothetical protein
LKAPLLLFVVCILFVGIHAQTAAPVGVEDVYLAKDNGKGEAGDAATVFKTTDIPIYCVVKLDSTTPATVKMNLVAENVPGVKSDTNVVSTTYTTKNGENRVNFYGKPSGKWTSGRYRAEIFVDGKLSKNLSFDIKDPVSTSAGMKGFQPPKRAVQTATKPKKNPYTTASVVNP